MALSENYRTETIGRSDCRPIVRLSADTIVRWDYRPNPNKYVIDFVHAGIENVSLVSVGFFVHIIQSQNDLHVTLKQWLWAWCFNC